MRIGFVGNVPPPIGGAEVFLRQFLSHFLQNRQHSAVLIRWRKQIFRYFPETVERTYAPAGTIRQQERWKTYYLFEARKKGEAERYQQYQRRMIAHFSEHGREAAEIFRKERVQMIHAHMLYPNALFAGLAARALSIPFVLTIHGMLEFRILEDVRQKTPALAALVEEAFQKANWVVGVSDEIVAACRTYGAKRAMKITGGMDTEFYKPASIQKRKGKGNLFLGSVRKEKGAGVLLQAFERIADSPAEKLTLIGRPLLRGPVMDRARRNPRIHFAGERRPDEIRNAIRRAKLVVLPSASEGLPMSILETMACGQVALATKTGDLTRLIQHGKNGFHITRRTPAALARQILSVIDHPRRLAMGRAARRTALRFDIRRIVRQYIRVYRSTVQ